MIKLVFKYFSSSKFIHKLKKRQFQKSIFVFHFNTELLYLFIPMMTWYYYIFFYYYYLNNCWLFIYFFFFCVCQLVNVDTSRVDHHPATLYVVNIWLSVCLYIYGVQPELSSIFCDLGLPYITRPNNPMKCYTPLRHFPALWPLDVTFNWWWATKHTRHRPLCIFHPFTPLIFSLTFS